MHFVPRKERHWPLLSYNLQWIRMLFTGKRWDLGTKKLMSLFHQVGSWGNYVGVRGVSLMDSPTSTCMISGTIQHELTHALGFYHEQSRPDRDTYVAIQWNNIQQGKDHSFTLKTSSFRIFVIASAYNFDKYNSTDVDTQMTPYDYGSVMHYGSTAFAINSSSPSIIAVLNSTAGLGQRVRLSPIDILEIQRYYGCVPTPPDPNATTTTTTASTTRTTTTTTSTTRTTTSSTTSQTTTTTSATTTSRTTSTSATTTTATTTTSTSATTATTTSATTATTTSETTTTETTSTTTAAGSSLHGKLQSSWTISVLGLFWLMHAVKPAHRWLSLHRSQTLHTFFYFLQ